MAAVLRQTRQVGAIQAVVEQAGRPLSAQELWKEARRRVPQLGMATVYRQIKRLIEQGWIVPVTLPGEPDRYELAELGHHHHFRCRKCKRVFDIKGCLGDWKRLVPRGFRVESHDVLITGLCRDCAGAK
jgi:Fur family ferric uptake transcriptional regulator